MSLFISNDRNGRIIKNDPFDLQLFSEKRKELYVHLKIIRANEILFGESMVVGQSKILEAHSDPVPESDADLSNRHFTSECQFCLIEDVVFVAVDQGVQVSNGPKNQAA